MNRLVLVLLALGTVSALNTLTRLTEGTIPPSTFVEVDSTTDLTEEIKMIIGLTRPGAAQLEATLLERSHPESANYGQWISNEEISALAKPTQTSVNTVVDWLSANGIQEVTFSPDQDYAKFNATRAQVQDLLNAEFRTYVHLPNNKTFHRITDAQRVPTEVAEVIDCVVGASGWPVEKSLFVNHDADAVEIVPSVINTRYNVSTTQATASGNKRAVAEFQGQYIVPSDLCDFYKSYSLNGSCKFTIIGTNIPISSSTESALDIEYQSAVDDEVPLDFYIYPGDDFCSDLLDWAGQLLSSSSPGLMHSVSYGAQYYNPICDSSVRSRLSEDMMTLGNKGITVTFASGDSGSGYYSRGGFNQGYLVPSFPADIPYVLAVGATTFGDFGTNTNEEVAVTQFGSGGGFSFNFDAPDYQKSTIASFFKNYQGTLPKSGTYAASGRGTPDVAALGQNYVVTVDGQKEPGVGGTSCASPVFSGVLTRINDARLNAGKKSIGFINQVLYSNTNAAALYDVTVGTDKIGLNKNGWDCQKGWDPVTGLGTPNYPELEKVFMGLP